MTKTFSFFVKGLPRAKNYNQTKRGDIYLKPEVKAWEKLVATEATIVAGPGYKKMFGAVKLFMDFFMPIPKSRKDVEPGQPHLQDPDLRNLGKACEDGIKKILFMDDNLVYRGADSKVWCRQGEEGVKVIVIVEELDVKS